MGTVNAGNWGYTAGYGWNWRSARAVSGALASLALPMPAWLRRVVAHCLLTRVALHADAHGIWGSAGPRPAGAGGPCPWKDVTEVVVWRFDHLKVIGLARRGDAVGVGPAAKPVAPRAARPSAPPRRRSFRRHPSYPAFIAPDGSPYEEANVVTTNGWCVDTAALRATVRHFAPHAGFTDLSSFSVAPDAGGLIATAFEVPAGLAAGALALVLLTGRSVAVRRRHRRSARPEAWLESGRADAENSPLARLHRGRLAAWALRLSWLTRRPGRPGGRGLGRRSRYAVRRSR
jgi:hypothetical protein